MLNTLLFQGILVSDPKLEISEKTGEPIVWFRLIGTGSRENKKESKVSFLFVVKGNLAERFAKDGRFRKNSRIIVEATLDQRVYDDEQETVLYYATVRRIIDDSLQQPIPPAVQKQEPRKEIRVKESIGEEMAETVYSLQKQHPEEFMEQQPMPHSAPQPEQEKPIHKEESKDSVIEETNDLNTESPSPNGDPSDFSGLI